MGNAAYGKHITPKRLADLQWQSDIVRPVRPLGVNAWQAVSELLAEVRLVTAERDAAVRDVKISAFSDNPCMTCFHNDKSRGDFPCKRGYGWCGGNAWGYRGLCAENAPEGNSDA